MSKRKRSLLSTQYSSLITSLMSLCVEPPGLAYLREDLREDCSGRRFDARPPDFRRNLRAKVLSLAPDFIAVAVVYDRRVQKRIGPVVALGHVRKRDFQLPRDHSQAESIHHI